MILLIQYPFPDAHEKIIHYKSWWWWRYATFSKEKNSFASIREVHINATMLRTHPAIPICYYKCYIPTQIRQKIVSLLGLFSNGILLSDRAFSLRVCLSALMKKALFCNILVLLFYLKSEYSYLNFVFYLSIRILI